MLRNYQLRDQIKKYLKILISLGFGIISKNGSGKTLLKTIINIIEPSSILLKKKNGFYNQTTLKISIFENNKFQIENILKT